MPRANKKKSSENNAGTSRPTPAPRRRPGSARVPFIIVSAVVAIVVVLVGIAYYQQYYAPFQRVVINVDDTKIKMGYFLDRARISGSGGIGMLQTLTNEILIGSGTASLGITVTPQDVDNQLRKAAAGSDNVTISDAEFKEWYRQLLNENRMSDAKYRETVRNQLLSSKLQSYLNTEIPPSIEHAHVYGIFVGTYEEALAAKQRVESGDDFSKVAQEISIDSGTAEKGGELDWIPQGALVMGNMDPFSLEVGKVSDPLAVVQDPNTPPSTYYVIMVTETAVREIQPGYLPEVQSTKFSQWLVDETGKHKVKWDYNSEIDAWVNWQLTKNSPSGSQSSQSGG